MDRKAWYSLETRDIMIARDICGFYWEIVLQCQP